MRLKQRRNVLLPQPDGPISAVTCLSAMGIDRFLSARFWPYQKFRLSTCAFTLLTVRAWRVSSTAMLTRGVATPTACPILFEPGGERAGSSLRKPVSCAAAILLVVSMRMGSPVDLFAEAITNPDRHRIHQQ